MERDVHSLSRRELLARSGRLAAVGLVPGLVRFGRAAEGDRLDALAQGFDGAVVRRSDAAYAQARLLWNPRFDAASRPLAIAYPASIRDVQKTVRWVREHDVPFAIRSGGHSYAGWSTTRGLVVDVSRLAAVHPRADGTARIGAGARLGDVNAHLWSAGRAMPVGSCPSVGIAGLTLGGGHGFSSRAHGLACDSVIGIEVVTADGRFVHCDAEREPDLFWALRGAGAGSFGIVTKLAVRTFAAADVATVNVVWPWDDVREVVRAWQAFAPSAPDALSCVLALRPSQGGAPPRVAINGQVLGTKEEATALIAPLTGVGAPTRVVVANRPFIGAAGYLAGADPDVRRSYKAKSNYVPRALGDEAIDVLVRAVETVNGDPRFGSAELVAFAHGGAINRPTPAETAYVHRDALFSIRYAAFWPADAPPDTEDAVLRWIDGTHTAIAPFVSRQAVQNYADAELAGWASAYYGANLPRLAAIKREHDADNLFRYPQSVPTRVQEVQQ